MEVDLLIIGGKVINVFNSSVEEIPVAVFDGQIVGLGEYSARAIYDLKGKFLAPGFIEGHIHIESSKLTPPRFGEAVIPHGTATVIADPHEIANVWGIDGIKFMIDSSQDIGMSIFYMLPSCVPATSMETSGASLSAEDLEPLLKYPSVLGVGELMNFPGAYSGDKSILEKVALSAGTRPVDGHAPGLSGNNLSAYLLAGPSTDHECFKLDEAEEKLARGMRIMIREGSTARNLEALLPLVNESTERRCMFVSDDRRSGDLLEDGHMDHILRKAVKNGLDPLTGIRMVTLNTAEAFGLRGRGGIGPGWRADLVALDNLEDFNVTEVWNNGSLVAKNGSCLAEIRVKEFGSGTSSLPVPRLSPGAFDVKDKGSQIRVIGLLPGQIVTKALLMELPVENGLVVPDPTRDVVKLAVVDRHSGKGRTGVGFVHGLGIRKGAIGSTVAHDSHNIIVAGVNDKSMFAVVNHLVAMGGGQVVVDGDRVLADLPLPVAGLMSDRPARDVATNERVLIDASRKLGCELDDPFMALSFLALPVIPELKLTDHGLVDVGKFKIVSLYG